MVDLGWWNVFHTIPTYVEWKQWFFRTRTAGKNQELVRTYLPIRLLTTYSMLRKAWWFYSSAQIWSHNLGAMRLGWAAIHVYWLCFSTIIPCVCMEKPHDIYYTTSLECGPSTNNILNPEDGLVVPEILAKSGPTEWVLYGLDEQDPSVLIVFQDCYSLPMHPQNMWNVWKHIHGLCFFTQQHTQSWGWFGGFAVLTKSGPTARVI